MSLLKNLLTEPIMEALGWTILHSIWQAGAIALLLALAFICMRKNSSQVRYFVAATALFTVFVISLVTFGSIYRDKVIESQSITVNELLDSEGEMNKVIIYAPTQELSTTESLKQQFVEFSNYFSQHLPFIVSVWLLGVIILTLRFLGGFAYIQRLKHYKTQAVSDYWEGTLRYLSAQVGVKKSVKLMESALVQVPMVVGYFKPVILLPIGTLTGLSQHQIESILAHELAHIRRHDYFVNIAQSLLEIMFFFNPFIWWISAKIREERENCCDDIAISVIGDQLTFIKTLTTLEEMRLQTTEFALGFAGHNKMSLLNRVNRLLKQRNQSSTFSEGFISAIVLFFCLAIASINANANYNWQSAGIIPETNITSMDTQIKEQKKALEEELHKKQQNLALLEKEAQLAKKEGLIQVEDTIKFGNGFMIVTDKRGKITIFKDGQVIPPDEYDTYADAFEVKESEVTLSPKSENQVSIKLDKLDKKDDIEIDNQTVIVIDEDEMVKVNVSEMPSIPGIHIKVDSVNSDINIKVNPENEDSYSYSYSYGDKNKKNNIVIDLNGLEFFSEEAWEKWGEEFEAWGEKLEKELEELELKLDRDYKNSRIIIRSGGKSAQKALKEHKKAEKELRKAIEQNREIKDNIVIDLNIPDIKHEIDTKVKVKIKELTKNLKFIKEEMIKDGIIDSNAEDMNMTYKKGLLKVNGKALSDEHQKKYKKLFKERMGVELNGDSSWNWNYTDDDE